MGRFYTVSIANVVLTGRPCILLPGQSDSMLLTFKSVDFKTSISRNKCKTYKTSCWFQPIQKTSGIIS